jgi:hypothetical protein
VYRVDNLIRYTVYRVDYLVSTLFIGRIAWLVHCIEWIAWSVQEGYIPGYTGYIYSA